MSLRAALAASAATFLFAAPAAAQESSAGDAPTSDADRYAGSDEEIIVTAQKREQVLIEVPQSITVVGEQTLQRQQANDFQDYVGLVPGLSLEATTPGVTRISLRGINTGGVASTVGVYVDETPFGSSSGLANAAILAGDFDTFDIARVEVLRGPQGTLYGASSLGGVLKFVTNAPDTKDFLVRGQIGAETVSGGDMSYSGGAIVNVPVSDTFAVRASGFYREIGGFIDSIGTEGSDVEEDINDAKVFGGRVSALFKPSDRLSIRLSALAQNIEVDSSSYVESDRATGALLYGRLSQSQIIPEFNDVDYRLYNGAVDWDFGFASLMSSTSYGIFHQELLSDLTFQFGGLISAVLGRPLGLFQSQVTETKKFTQEFRLVSPESDTFEWLLGAYYTNEDSAIDQDFTAFDRPAETPATGLPLLGAAQLVSDYEEIAAFGNATIHLGPRFEVTFGGRVSRNEQSATQALDGLLVGGPSNFEDSSSSETVFTYSVAPRFEVSEHASLYARVASGYRPGGPNVLPTAAPPGTPGSYESDRLTSFELGAKAETADGRFAIDASVYYLDWKDIQLIAQINNVGLNINGGTARSVGGEVTATVRPTAGLSIGFNAAYVDAQLTEDTNPLVGGLDGDPLPNTPELSANVSVDYDWRMGNVAPFVGANLRFVGEQVAEFDPSFREEFGRQPLLSGYEVVDLRAGVDLGRFTVQAYVKNLTNARGRTSRFGDPGTLPNNAVGTGIIRPRTVGVTLTAGF
ncbi:TonB-dependent receptor [Sphingomonas deserti]|uniref:TonB-dependent receptor n=2 Tax=Allosphingosinicella deserti TaxID=2116704 RepID=A0A2P7QKT6_9SPHN|nr:TonB-dependent receptor [Sphingomonas deserti]